MLDPRFDCNICLELCDAPCLARLCLADGCPLRVCRACATDLVRNHVGDLRGTVRPVRCPAPACGAMSPVRVWGAAVDEDARADLLKRFHSAAEKALAVRCTRCRNTATVLPEPFAPHESPPPCVRWLLRRKGARGSMRAFVAGDDAALNDIVERALRSAAAGAYGLAASEAASRLAAAERGFAEWYESDEKLATLRRDPSAAAQRKLRSSVDSVRKAFLIAELEAEARAAAARARDEVWGSWVGRAGVPPGAAVASTGGVRALVKTVADVERRATLFLDLIRRACPTVSFACRRCAVHVQHCFVCGVPDVEHKPADCAARTSRELAVLGYACPLLDGSENPFANTRRCPNCSFPCVKIDGCDSVRCGSCGRPYFFSSAARLLD